jgi:P-type Cu+ transporter
VAFGAVAIYFEAAAVITVLVLLGPVLELRAREQTGGAIRALLDLAPKTARRVRADGTDEEVGLDAVMVGDRLRVRPGEKAPVDGELMEGRTSIDDLTTSQVAKDATGSGGTPAAAKKYLGLAAARERMRSGGRKIQVCVMRARTILTKL